MIRSFVGLLYIQDQLLNAPLLKAPLGMKQTMNQLQIGKNTRRQVLNDSKIDNFPQEIPSALICLFQLIQLFLPFCRQFIFKHNGLNFF